MDKFDKVKRSEIMSKISGKNTKPEIIVRKLLHRMGYRFRLHRIDLPGKPDIVLPKYKKVILVHGCFWHGHDGCVKSKLPETNKDFWLKKIGKNIERDLKHFKSLEELGWDVLIIWSCEMSKKADLITIEQRLGTFLDKR
ncbi:very short patch repair endonuclease [Paenibacillus thermotolerans]|uniref:very short patch repair endonuclease n=1 Tax=Paenibacillus thermotolerans TaxID=3027807 RepID=UPI0023679DC5|nr:MULTISPECIES: DNA mismatch endonuclease Vsr [unclassified Paenibacillus]